MKPLFPRLARKLICTEYKTRCQLPRRHPAAMLSFVYRRSICRMWRFIAIPSPKDLFELGGYTVTGFISFKRIVAYSRRICNQNQHIRSKIPDISWIFNVMQHKKSPEPSGLIHFNAEDGSRTHKVLLPHGPEPCASANSATSARTGVIIYQKMLPVNSFLKFFLRVLLAKVNSTPGVL